MVTKLKNSRKFAVLLMIVVILTAACGMKAAYPAFAEEMKVTLTGKTFSEEMLESIARTLLRGNCYLYNEVYEEEDTNEVMETYANDNYFLYRKYMDSEMFNAQGKPMTGKNSQKVYDRLSAHNTDYAFRAAFVYDAEGGLKNVEVDGTGMEEREKYAIEKSLYAEQEYNYTYLSTPSEVKIIYGFTQENLKKYEKECYYTGYLHAEELSNNQTYLRFEWAFLLFVAAAAVLMSRNPAWKIGKMKVFHAPAEVVVLVCVYALAMEKFYAEVVWNTLQHSLAGIAEKMGFNGMSGYMIESGLNIFMWFCVFAVAYWAVSCFMEVFTLKKAYWKERTLCAKAVAWCRKGNDAYGNKIKHGAEETVGLFRKTWRKCREELHRIYDGLLHVDFRDRTNRTIGRIVILNFIVLALVSFLWYYGIFALMIYSVLLFFFLRKYFGDIRKKYAQLLEATNLLAEGNLDAPIEADMGIFNPIKTELKKIQKGFQKAVQEEVKSERMKTELITNVSHDLKTPLTAIITYVDLLKSEKDPEKQKEYLDVLERKSLRLKVLIEDLFEISKAASKTVTMNFMQVDIIGLLKQVGFECEEKIKAAHLDFRWNLPEEKLVLTLDSQKTYRIFENLIVNITKYALPYTRVYIELTEQEKEVVISMKNVSAAELNFNTDEITDRFVRGDLSRNTEGSGLGLAIAKSFTELQNGTMQISTDGDLFKVEIRFPR